MSHCESCECQGNIVEVVYDTTQQNTGREPHVVSVTLSPTDEEITSSDDKPP